MTGLMIKLAQGRCDLLLLGREHDKIEALYKLKKEESLLDELKKNEAAFDDWSRKQTEMRARIEYYMKKVDS